ncbi:MAG: serine/threonine-protein phosphatase [Deltaproteobacteria bacterium]|uniref:Serine/threonine-protein phosphatase n=1 Tax=Candidatus Zymogenus saltonus TaxID=2844893 RepID=A0A9D8KFG3_9DELT|nr:serine/threonine-protein phosphatase [Candidatus Zymogenus saltonus]
MKNTHTLPITFSWRTDTGKVRENNEDSFLALRQAGKNPLNIRSVLIVADGMGGHVGGDRASSSVVRFVDEIFKPKSVSKLDKFIGKEDKAIVSIIKAADKRVRDLSGGDTHKAPGTTFTGAFIIDNKALIGHVGDSRAYHIRNDEIVQVTEDHSYVASLVRDGKLTPEEAKDFPHKNVILKSLGSGESLKVDPPRKINLLDGDILLLCSDGLWDLVSDTEILSIIHKSKSIKIASDRLIKLANHRGGHDNITVVMAEFGQLKRNPKLFSDLKELPRIQPLSNKNFRNLLKGILVLLSILLVFIIWQIVKDYRGIEKNVMPRAGQSTSKPLGDIP